MISFLSPLWLILLALIPLLRWLHRFRQQSRIVPSTTLFLWHKTLQHKNSDGFLSTPDPRWLLRALFISLLILSLAESGLQTDNKISIEVWLDDSLSMFVTEEKQQRLETGLQQLQQYLLENKASTIQIHSLGKPGSILLLDAEHSKHWSARINEWVSAPAGEPSPPPPATLSPHSNHILLTDGADAALNQWAQSALLQHVIQVGKKTHNIALTRLSLRQPLNKSDNINGLARIENLSDTIHTTRFILQQDEQIIDSQNIELSASGSATATFSIAPLKHGNVQARLESVNDFLPLDDSLQLETSQLNPVLRYGITGDCSPHLMAVLESHPALIHDNSTVDLLINCNQQDDSRTGDTQQPTLRFFPPQSIQQTTQSAHWHQDLARQALRMTAGLAYSGKAPALDTNAIPILSADDRLLILKHKGSAQRIDCYLDVSDPVLTQRPEYPLLIFSLINQVTGQNLDSAPLTVTRDGNASRIAPLTLPELSTSPLKTQITQTSFTPVLLFAALLVLLLDASLATGLLNKTREQHK